MSVSKTFESQHANDKVRAKLARVIIETEYESKPVIGNVAREQILNESLILAQNQRWRRASDMQVERESSLRGASRVASG